MSCIYIYSMFWYVYIYISVQRQADFHLVFKRISSTRQEPWLFCSSAVGQPWDSRDVGPSSLSSWIRTVDPTEIWPAATQWSWPIPLQEILTYTTGSLKWEKYIGQSASTIWKDVHGITLGSLGSYIYICLLIYLYSFWDLRMHKCLFCCCSVS